MIITDQFKNCYNANGNPRIYFWRDAEGHEVDCIVEHGTVCYPIEIKLGQTIASNFFDNLSLWNIETKGDQKNSYLVYGGDQNQSRSAGNVVSWRKPFNLFS